MRKKKQKDDPFFFWESDMPDEAHIKREKNRARELRKTRWWQQKTASGCCHYCGEKVGFATLTMDHLLPLSKGGRSSRENIVPCCKQCNSIKKSMMPIEWDEYCQNNFHPTK